MQRSLYEKLSAVSLLMYLSSPMPPKRRRIETKEEKNPYYHNGKTLDLFSAGVITAEELVRLLIDPKEATAGFAPPIAAEKLRKWKEEYEADPEVRWHAVFPPLPAAR